MLVVASDNVVKNIGDFESKVKACFASTTIVDSDRCFKFTRGLARSSNNSPVNTDRFVIGGLVVQIIIEIAEVILERKVDEVVTNFCG